MYARGKWYDKTKKFAISAAIKVHGGALDIQSVAKRCNISWGWGFAQKVWQEMMDNDERVLDPLHTKQGRPDSPGEKSLDEFDHFALMSCIFILRSRAAL